MYLGYSIVLAWLGLRFWCFLLGLTPPIGVSEMPLAIGVIVLVSSLFGMVRMVVAAVIGWCCCYVCCRFSCCFNRIGCFYQQCDCRVGHCNRGAVSTIVRKMGVSAMLMAGLGWCGWGVSCRSSCSC